MAEKKGFGLMDLLDRITFTKVFLLFILNILFFASIYSFLTYFYTQDGLNIASKNLMVIIKDAIYYSVVTATSTGYGDIVPSGISKLFTVLEMITGVIFTGIVVSKLVSFKQERVLDELYDISFEEKIDGLRSNLFLYRTDLNKVVDLIELEKVSRRKISDLWMNFAVFETTLSDLVSTMSQSVNKKHAKKIDHFRVELILNSINSSLKKTTEIIILMSTKDIKWKTKEAITCLQSIVKYCQKVKELYKNEESVMLKEKLNDMETLIKDLLYHIEDGKPKE